MKRINKTKLTKQERILLIIQNFFGLGAMCKFKYYIGYLIGYKKKKQQLKKLQNLDKKYGSWKEKAELIIRNSNSNLLYEMLDAYIVSDIKRINKSNIHIDCNDVIVVCAIKNEFTRIKEFLKYYRTLGIKLFLICDNNSTDGTIDYLKHQNDVVLYHTTDKYNSQKKCAWCNRMISDFGDNRWYLIVDADEFMWYPEAKKIDINKYAKILYEKGIYAVKGLMLEMYPEGLLGDSRQKIDSFVDEYIYYDRDSDYYIYDQHRQLIFGGCLNRLFNDENILQTKVPLFYQTDKRFNIGSHHIFPFKEDISVKFGIVLKHYKFLPGDENKIRSIVKEKNYANNSRWYKKFVSIYDSNGVVAYSKYSKKWNDRTIIDNLPFIKELAMDETC